MLARWIDVVSQLLEPDERNAVRGDLAESGETGWPALMDVLGLVARRQAALWNDWRPWLALAGAVVPLGILLSTLSRLVAGASAVPLWMYFDNWTWTYITNAGARLDLLRNLADIFRDYVTLACWSWASGFALGSLSRRTIQINGALFCLVVLLAKLLEASPHLLPAFKLHENDNTAVFSLTLYRVMLPLILQAGLVLLPSVWGMRQALRLARFPPLLRTILWASAIVTVSVLAMQNWFWLLCWSGGFHACFEWMSRAGYSPRYGRSWVQQIPTEPLALLGLGVYLLVTAIWRHRSLENHAG